MINDERVTNFFCFFCEVVKYIGFGMKGKLLRAKLFKIKFFNCQILRNNTVQSFYVLEYTVT
jgi:hypothetical protein